MCKCCMFKGQLTETQLGYILLVWSNEYLSSGLRSFSSELIRTNCRMTYNTITDNPIVSPTKDHFLTCLEA